MLQTKIAAQTDLDIAHRMMAQGRMAAALDGIHLIIRGITIVTILFFQYFAEARDWLPSSQLWLWQPFVCIGLVLTLFLGRRSPFRRWSHEASRIYVTAFAGAGFTLGLYVIASGLGGRPDQFMLVLLATGLLGLSFLVTAVAIRIPQLHFATIGWWLTFALFCFRGKLVLSDFFIVMAAFTLFMIGPGLFLILRRRQFSNVVS